MTSLIIFLKPLYAAIQIMFIVFALSTASQARTTVSPSSQTVAYNNILHISFTMEKQYRTRNPTLSATPRRPINTIKQSSHMRREFQYSPMLQDTNERNAFVSISSGAFLPLLRPQQEARPTSRNQIYAKQSYREWREDDYLSVTLPNINV